MNRQQKIMFIVIAGLLSTMSWAESALVEGTVIRDPFARPDMGEIMDDSEQDEATEQVHYMLRAVVTSNKQHIALIVDGAGKEYFVKVGDELKNFGTVTKIAVKDGVTVSREDDTVDTLKMPRYL